MEINVNLCVFVFLFFLLALIFWQWAESPWLCCFSAPHFCPRFGLSGFHGTSSWSWTVLLWKELSPNHLSVTWKTWSVHMPLFCPLLSRDSLPTVRTEEVSYLNYRCETHSLLRKHWMQYLSHMLWDYTRVNVTQVSCILQLYLCDTWNC